MTAGAPHGRLGGAEFFSRSWRGRGAVTSLRGRILRRFTVAFDSVWSEAEQAYLTEEAVAYDQGRTLSRSWHITRGRGGALVGLEASQGGRMFVEDRAEGFIIRYDRLRFLPGPNVASLRLRIQPTAGVGLQAAGWTSLLGVVPLWRTRLALSPT